MRHSMQRILALADAMVIDGTKGPQSIRATNISQKLDQFLGKLEELPVGQSDNMRAMCRSVVSCQLSAFSYILHPSTILYPLNISIFMSRDPNNFRSEAQPGPLYSMDMEDLVLEYREILQALFAYLIAKRVKGAPDDGACVTLPQWEEFLSDLHVAQQIPFEVRGRAP